MNNAGPAREGGFTLIELIVVIVLLGILGAAATARFQDLSGNANAAARQGVQAELQGASAVNYAAAVLPGSTPDVDIDSTNNVCATILDGLMQTGALPTGYTTAGNTAPACTAAGDTVNCTVTQTATTTAFTVPILCTGG